MSPENPMDTPELFELNKERLEQLAYRGLNVKEFKSNEFVVVCIDVEDPNWRGVVDGLMPGANWQEFRDKGQRPVARGIVPNEAIVPYLKDTVPAIKDALEMELTENEVRAVVMANNRASVFIVEPQPQFKNN